MENCIFCKIVSGKIPSYKIDEDGKHIAILDLFPNTKGMTLVIPKKHKESEIFSMESEDYHDILEYTKKVAKKLEKGLNVKRVAVVSEGMGINHAHIKLYPLHGLKEKFVETWAKEKVFFENYQGYITTQMGEKADEEQLSELAKELKKI